MKLGINLALSATLIGGVAIVGPGFSLNRSITRQSQDAHLVRRSVIKVHTDQGVITLPGTADSWDAVEEAVFVADSIADVQIVNNEIPWRIANE